MPLALVSRCLLLAALVAASAACSAYWYASPFPKPAGLSAMGFLLEWLGFVFLWFAFRRWTPLLWVAGALLVFPLAQALVNWMAGEMNLAVDFRGWGGFQAVFMLRLMVSCWLCMAAYAVYFIFQRLQGRSANVVD